MPERWSKEQIFFFRTGNHDVSHSQPFFVSDMRQLHGTNQPPPPEVMHPFPDVLSLGILLLEPETGKAIETLRTTNDYIDPVNKVVGNNTDFTAALRAVEATAVASPQYKGAV